MGKRVDLLMRAARNQASPFFLCNIVACRARQLAKKEPAAVVSDFITRAIEEFFAGKLNYELVEPRPSSIAGANMTEGAPDAEPAISGRGEGRTL